MSHEPCSLGKLDFVTFPAGDFTFEVLRDEPCKVAKVWLLPVEFRIPPNDTVQETGFLK
jgi:hypothetical protein